MNPLLTVDDLRVAYPRRRRGPARPAVDGVSFSVDEGESVGLVGESGSGKTTIGRALLGLVAPTGGAITFAGTVVTDLRAGERGDLSADMQAVFQDPFGSLNPFRTVGQSLLEPLAQLRTVDSHEAQNRVIDLLERVGLHREDRHRYPQQFSGGQRQRIAIARALAVEPRLIVCDEPVSALDVSTQAQVLNLLDRLRRELGVSYLFIGHNLAVSRHVCQRLVVMFRGQMMETGPAGSVTDAPLHPYTQALVAAAPVADVKQQRAKRQARRGLLKLPVTSALDTGCVYAERCPFVAPVCTARRPELLPSGDSHVACHRYEPSSGHPSPVTIGRAMRSTAPRS